MMIHILIVGLGGFFGAIARYLISKQLNTQSAFLPWGTLTVNLAGAFLLGLINGAQANLMMVLLFGTGFMGAFTTFSTLKFELTKMFLSRQGIKFFLYTITTYGIGIILAYLGYLLGSFI